MTSERIWLKKIAQRLERKEKNTSRDFTIGILNVGTMTGKGREVADVMERRKIYVLCVQETRHETFSLCSGRKSGMLESSNGGKGDESE